jgi:hypothetical protein
LAFWRRAISRSTASGQDQSGAEAAALVLDNSVTISRDDQ